MKQTLFSRDFTLMLLGQIVSLFGNAVLRFALSLYVLDLTGSAALFGGVLALSMAPTILLSPVGGILADRPPRQRIMYVLDFLTAFAVWAFAAFGLGGAVTPPAALLLFLSAIQALYQPAVLSSVPLLVPPAELTRGNALVTQVGALSSLLGPVAGGVFYGFWGMEPLCLISGGCLLASAGMECFLHIPFTLRAEAGLAAIPGDLRQAGRFLSQARLLPLLAVIAGMNAFLSSLYLVGLPFFVKITLGLSSQLYSLVEAAMGTGTILGAALVGLLGPRLSLTEAWKYLLLSTVTLAVMAPAVAFRDIPMLSWAILLGATLAGMACAAVFSVLAQSFFQMLTPQELLGKVGSFVTAVATCAIPLGQGMYGLLLDRLPGWMVLLLAFAACLPLALLGKWSLAQVKKI